MIDVKDKRIGITHDTYLKLMHLDKTFTLKFKKYKKVEVILIDEAQDVNPCEYSYYP